MRIQRGNEKENEIISLKALREERKKMGYLLHNGLASLSKSKLKSE